MKKHQPKNKEDFKKNPIARVTQDRWRSNQVTGWLRAQSIVRVRTTEVLSNAILNIENMYEIFLWFLFFLRVVRTISVSEENLFFLEFLFSLVYE
jgi:hypothetical protein